MKFTKLLVLSALWLVGLSASAEIVDGVRQKPVPTATYEAGAEVYLYNVGAELFFTAGNDWQTRASVGEVGQKVIFTASEAALAQGEDVVELKNYVPSKNAILSAFTDGVASIWTDNNNGANHYWKVTANGNYYRISNATFETSLFLGWDKSKNDTRLYLLAADAEVYLGNLGEQREASLELLLLSLEDILEVRSQRHTIERTDKDGLGLVFGIGHHIVGTLAEESKQAAL